MQVNAAVAGDCRHILVSPAGEADDDTLVPVHVRYDFAGMRDRVSALNGADDTFRACKVFKGGDGLLVGHRNILSAPSIVQPCVLGADAGIIKARGNRIDLFDLPVLVLAEIGLHAVEDARASLGYGRCVMSGFDAFTASLAADQADIFITDKVIESISRI